APSYDSHLSRRHDRRRAARRAAPRRAPRARDAASGGARARAVAHAAGVRHRRPARPRLLRAVRRAAHRGARPAAARRGVLLERAAGPRHHRDRAGPRERAERTLPAQHRDRAQQRRRAGPAGPAPRRRRAARVAVPVPRHRALRLDAHARPAEPRPLGVAQGPRGDPPAGPRPPGGVLVRVHRRHLHHQPLLPRHAPRLGAALQRAAAPPAHRGARVDAAPRGRRLPRARQRAGGERRARLHVPARPAGRHRRRGARAPGPPVDGRHHPRDGARRGGAPRPRRRAADRPAGRVALRHRRDRAQVRPGLARAPRPGAAARPVAGRVPRLAVPHARLVARARGPHLRPRHRPLPGAALRRAAGAGRRARRRGAGDR
ncbi:MAG: Alkaline phosphatase; Type I phosphodiesterase/nucleotide pyrophosphatase precursor, partial [uncultured Gemmatimonadaceae bacterium]